MRKIYIFPNLITTANLFCGFYSITSSTQEQFQVAAWMIVAAGIFDMLDGRIARMAKATSAFGVQYDSMADLISFGLAPAMLLHQMSLQNLDRYGTLAAFFYACCAALRLARFNITTGKFPKKYFQGLSSPIAAGAICTFVIFQSATQWPETDSSTSLQVIALIQALLLGSLMVSSIPFPSFKEVNWRARSSFGYLMVGVLCMILIALKPEITLFLLVTGYILISLVWSLFMIATGRLDLSVTEPSPSNSTPAQT